METKELFQRYFGFPEGLTYKEYKEIPSRILREHIVSRNRILGTDTYNRTMDKAKGDEWAEEETYVLQLRRSPHDYLITCGIGRSLERLLEIPITQSELNFAREFYQGANVKHFNQQKWEWVIKDNGGFLPIKVDCLPEGTAILPGDPVLRVTGPGELAAHWEPEWHRVFYPSLVATTAHEIARIIGPNRFVEAGMRGANIEESHLIAADAMYIGGGLFLTSDDAAAACYPELRDSGTLAHRFLAYKPTEREAIIRALTSLDRIAPVVDLNDTLEGIETVLSIKKEYRYIKKPVWMRMDSGDVAGFAIQALAKQRGLGFTDPNLDKVAISNIESFAEMIAIDDKVHRAGFDPQQFVVYVAGELLIAKDTSRNAASSAFKLSRHLADPKMKHSNSPGKESFPGDPTLAQVDGRRLVAQVGEYPNGDLFVPAYRPGKRIDLEILDLPGARARADKTFNDLQERISVKERSEMSPMTRKLINTLGTKHEDDIFVSAK